MLYKTLILIFSGRPKQPDFMIPPPDVIMEPNPTDFNPKYLVTSGKNNPPPISLSMPPPPPPGSSSSGNPSNSNQGNPETNFQNFVGFRARSQTNGGIIGSSRADTNIGGIIGGSEGTETNIPFAPPPPPETFNPQPPPEALNPGPGPQLPPEFNAQPPSEIVFNPLPDPQFRPIPLPDSQSPPAALNPQPDPQPHTHLQPPPAVFGTQPDPRPHINFGPRPDIQPPPSVFNPQPDPHPHTHFGPPPPLADGRSQTQGSGTGNQNENRNTGGVAGFRQVPPREVPNQTTNERNFGSSNLGGVSVPSPKTESNVPFNFGAGSIGDLGGISVPSPKSESNVAVNFGSGSIGDNTATFSLGSSGKVEKQFLPTNLFGNVNNVNKRSGTVDPSAMNPPPGIPGPSVSVKNIFTGTNDPYGGTMLEGGSYMLPTDKRYTIGGSQQTSGSLTSGQSSGSLTPIQSGGSLSPGQSMGPLLSGRSSSLSSGQAGGNALPDIGIPFEDPLAHLRDKVKPDFTSNLGPPPNAGGSMISAPVIDNPTSSNSMNELNAILQGSKNIPTDFTGTGPNTNQQQTANTAGSPVDVINLGCTFRPYRNSKTLEIDERFYLQKVNGEWKTQPCALGSGYNETECRCSNYLPPEYPSTGRTSGTLFYNWIYRKTIMKNKTKRAQNFLSL